MNEVIVQDLPVSMIRPGDNDRTVFDMANLVSLSESIRDTGLAQPIIVRPVKTVFDSDKAYEIVAGERRFRAVSTILEWHTIPAIVREMTDEEASAVMLAENVHRVDLNPIDEANSYNKRILNFGWTVNMLSQKANVSPKRIADRLKLLELAPEIQHLVSNNQIQLSYAEVMCALDINRQRIAIKYLSSTDKPIMAVFRKIVGALLEDQMSEALFDMSAFFQQKTDEQEKESYESHNKTYPIDDTLPLIRKTKNVATSIETYIVEMVSSGNPHQFTAAAVVGRLYQGMIVAGLCFPPKNGPLESLKFKRRTTVEIDAELVGYARSFGMIED